PMPLSLMTPIPTPQGDLSVLSVLVWQADALLLAVLAGAVLAGLLLLLGPVAMLPGAGGLLGGMAGMTRARLRARRGWAEGRHLGPPPPRQPADPARGEGAGTMERTSSLGPQRPLPPLDPAHPAGSRGPGAGRRLRARRAAGPPGRTGGAGRGHRPRPRHGARRRRCRGRSARSTGTPAHTRAARRPAGLRRCLRRGDHGRLAPPPGPRAGPDPCARPAAAPRAPARGRDGAAVDPRRPPVGRRECVVEPADRPGEAPASGARRR